MVILVLMVMHISFSELVLNDLWHVFVRLSFLEM